MLYLPSNTRFFITFSQGRSGQVFWNSLTIFFRYIGDCWHDFGITVSKPYENHLKNVYMPELGNDHLTNVYECNWQPAHINIYFSQLVPA